jgi:hypothetical protein
LGLLDLHGGQVHGGLGLGDLDVDLLRVVEDRLGAVPRCFGRVALGNRLLHGGLRGQDLGRMGPGLDIVQLGPGYCYGGLSLGHLGLKGAGVQLDQHLARLDLVAFFGIQAGDPAAEFGGDRHLLAFDAAGSAQLCGLCRRRLTAGPRDDLGGPICGHSSIDQKLRGPLRVTVRPPPAGSRGSSHQQEDHYQAEPDPAFHRAPCRVSTLSRSQRRQACRALERDPDCAA